MQPDHGDALVRHLWDSAIATNELIYGSNAGHSVKVEDEDICGRCGGRVLRDLETGTARCAAGCGWQA